jgi:hypothetical protein
MSADVIGIEIQHDDGDIGNRSDVDEHKTHLRADRHRSRELLVQKLWWAGWSLLVRRLVPGDVRQQRSYVSHAFNEVKSAGTLKFQSSTGPVVSSEGVQRLLSEEHPVKLNAGA